MKFIYNTNTCKLHVQGYCSHAVQAKGCNNIVVFNSEDDALKYDGRAVSMCKICQRKREQNKNN